MSKFLRYNAKTGIFQLKRTGEYFAFNQNASAVEMEKLENFQPEENYNNPAYSVWLLRHSFGTPGGELEDYSQIPNYETINDRDRELAVAINNDSSLKNLEYRGMKLPINNKSYSHVVGPIHAGIIEPGHFRFYVSGEDIQYLHIRLGYQKRGVYDLLKNKTFIEAMPIAEAVASDSTISYAMSFARIYEKAARIKISDDLQLIRLILLETERLAMHIGDMGAIAGDIGYYSLLGVCSTDRGVPLGVMETLTGSRFGKGAIYPGEVRLNRKLNKDDFKTIVNNLEKLKDRIRYHVEKMMTSSTVRERLHGCGTISRHQVYRNGFVGMAARCTGVIQDLRLSEDIYHATGLSLWLTDYREELVGNAWARLYLRYIEFLNSTEWLLKVIPRINLALTAPKGFPFLKKEIQAGLYFDSVEGWRGPVLTALDLGSDGKILQTYLRDPSVLNWHALELAVRGELIGDFPLNNKSFNMSYVGVDL